MRIIKNQFLCRLLLLVAAAPITAQATWLGLTDGSYDVKLTCTSSSLFACPSQFDATLTISGAGASAMQAAINSELFTGNPGDGVFTNAIADFEFSILTNTPFSFISLRNDLSIANPFGLTAQWWVYCNNFSSGACTPNTAGNWVATPLANVPEPAISGLLLIGLVGIGAMRGSGALRTERG